MTNFPSIPLSIAYHLFLEEPRSCPSEWIGRKPYFYIYGAKIRMTFHRYMIKRTMYAHVICITGSTVLIRKERLEHLNLENISIQAG